VRNAKYWAFIVALAGVTYAAFALWRGWIVFQDGSFAAKALAVSIIAIPLLGVAFILREIRFGLTMQAMGRQLGVEGRLPIDDLPRTASGRVDKDVADQRFDEIAGLAESTDWRDWFHIALAYEDARDRKRARSAMRTAEKLFRSEPSVDK
jgi:hypothetical protein